MQYLARGACQSLADLASAYFFSRVKSMKFNLLKEKPWKGKSQKRVNHDITCIGIGCEVH